MDDDYGDIPDEDMILAFSQVTEAICPPATNSTNSRTGYQNTSSRVATVWHPPNPSLSPVSLLPSTGGHVLRRLSEKCVLNPCSLLFSMIPFDSICLDFRAE